MVLAPPSHRARGAAAAALAVVLPLLATGCARGGAGDATASRIAATASRPATAAPAVPASSAVATAPAPSAAVATAASTCGLADFVATALARVNERRAAGATCGAQGAFGPAPALAWNESLALAADGHSRDMVGANFFSHTGSAGSTLTSRVNATSYAWAGLAENLAAGTASIQATVDVWMASPGHCANLMAAAYLDLGLACVPGNANTAHRTYWTMTLGRPR